MHPRIHVTDDAHGGEPPSRRSSERRWAILYDADCGFCMWLLSALLSWDRAARLQPTALQRSEADDLLRALTPAERMVGVPATLRPQAARVSSLMVG
jgi:predicted DCC family thiol-disulfide oxidoreductase YuxK